MAKLSEMTVEERIKAFVGALFLLPVIAFGIAVAIGSHEADKAKASRDIEMAAAVAAGDPVGFATAFFPRTSATLRPARNAKTGLVDGTETLIVTMDMDPVPSSNLSARRAFGRRVAELVPAVLERFPGIEYVDVRGSAKMVDVRGRESVEDVMRTGFWRPNVSDVNWPKVQPENVFVLANLAVVHPRLRD